MNLADRKLCERTEALLTLLEPITHRQQGALMNADDYEPDPPEPDFEPDEEPLEEPTEIPEGWVEPAPEDLPDGDLPGAWSKSDFTGGDLDERSYAERGWVEGHDDNSASERGSHWEDPE